MNKVVDRIRKLYPKPICELVYSSPFELLVAVILSAQCTDKRVNIVTQNMFVKFNTPKHFAEMSQSDLEEKIHSCGFFRNKAKNIISASKDILNKYGGKVPATLDELVCLAGVGVKTASVVLAVAFGIPAIAVDTHVFRLSKRLGLADEKTPEKTQLSLEKIVPKDFWIDCHYALVLHGRYVCKAQNPKCNVCEMTDICKYYKDNILEGKK